MIKVPEHYVSRSLSKKQKAYAKRELLKSRKAYKKKKYYTRRKVKGYRSRRSSWENRVKKVYNIPEKTKLSISLLSRKSKCSKASLNKIVKKGMGAYYSSGSRPNQTAHSWGYARLYSALAGGPAAKVDMHILKDGCKKSSKSLKLSRNPRKNTTRKRVQLGGYRMKERITKFERSPLDNRYQQFKDRTPLGYYKSNNHNNRKRMRNYFNRHSGTPHRGRAIELERKKSKGLYNAKILSHEYLW
jgi:hypothetical protein